MAVTVNIPSVLRDYCGGERRLSVAGATVRASLIELKNAFPTLYYSVCDETGAVRRHVNVFVNTADVRDRNGLDTQLAPGDEITILPAVSGG